MAFLSVGFDGVDSCLLTPGGLDLVYIAQMSDIASFALGVTAGVNDQLINALVMNSTNRFKLIKTRANSAQLTGVSTGDFALSEAQTLQFIVDSAEWDSNDFATFKQFTTNVKCLAFLVRSNSGKWSMIASDIGTETIFGTAPVQRKSWNSDSGVNADAAVGTTVSFGRVVASTFMIRGISATLSASLVSGGTILE
jgi:hypothetical protein